MTKRTRWMLFFGLLAVVFTIAGAWLFRPPAAITRQNAAKIHVGMTQVEVETILGGPPRNETSGPLVLDPDLVEPADEGTLQTWIDFMFVEPAARRVMWHSDEVVIWVQWNAGYVNACGYFPQRRAEESPLETLRRWLRI